MHTDIALILRAALFTADKHRNQRRKDEAASPYINHPITLANTLASAGVDNPVVLVAALLHDTIEDTDTTAAELRADFGDEITDIVLEVTDDKSLSKAARKQLQIEHAPHLSEAAKMVKLADKISNLHDVSDSPPRGWALEREREYFDWARQVIQGLRGTHPLLEQLFEKEYARRP